MRDMRVYTETMPIRWGDMDAMGHVNNTIYFRFMEQARISWFNVAGLYRNGASSGPILAHVSCDFLRPLTYPGNVVVTQTITRVGRSSVDMDLAIAHEQSGEVYATGKSVIVWMDYANGRSAPWPDTLKSVLGT